MRRVLFDEDVPRQLRPRGLGISTDGILYVGSLSGVVQAFRIGK